MKPPAATICLLAGLFLLSSAKYPDNHTAGDVLVEYRWYKVDDAYLRADQVAWFDHHQQTTVVGTVGGDNITVTDGGRLYRLMRKSLER